LKASYNFDDIYNARHLVLEEGSTVLPIPRITSKLKEAEVKNPSLVIDNVEMKANHNNTDMFANEEMELAKKTLKQSPIMKQNLEKKK